MTEIGILTTVQKVEKNKQNVLGELALNVKNNLKKALDFDGKGKEIQFDHFGIINLLQYLAERKQYAENPTDREPGADYKNHQRMVTFEVMEDFLSGKKVDKIKLIEALDLIELNIVTLFAPDRNIIRNFLNQIKENFC